jgi:putative integral membrane protein (TIGR02587 family)
MAVGALYLCASLASTEEMVLISYMMSPWHVFALMLFSLLIVHGFAYAMVSRGKSPLAAEPVRSWPVFAHYTVVGYAIALLVSVYMLWSFGRTDDLALGQIMQATVVLGFPAAIGAGVARLIF